MTNAKNLVKDTAGLTKNITFNFGLEVMARVEHFIIRTS